MFLFLDTDFNVSPSKGLKMKNFGTAAVFSLGMSLLAVSAGASQSDSIRGDCVDRTGHGMSFNSQSEAYDGAMYTATTLCESRGRQEGYPATYSERTSSCEQKLSHDGTKYYWDCTTSGECCW
jgi:hypothetical protein